MTSSRNNSLSSGADGESFDYVVAGSGTAGCVIATRLSQDPNTRVLLLEAGAAVTSATMSDPAGWPRLAGTSVDWAYQTVPQPGTDNAERPWPRGKVLGGSSAINGMMHIRGDRSSYDGGESAGVPWVELRRLLPFFKRSEPGGPVGSMAYRAEGHAACKRKGRCARDRWRCRPPAISSGRERGAHAGEIGHHLDAQVAVGLRRRSRPPPLAAPISRSPLAPHPSHRCRAGRPRIA